MKVKGHSDRLTGARALVRDRGSQFVSAFDEIFRTEGLKILKTPVRTPVANAFAERWIGSIRRELLDRTVIWNQRQVRHEAPSVPGGDERTPPPGCRSSPVKLRAA